RIKAIQPFLNVYIDERFEQALVEAYEIDRILDSGKFLEQYSVEKAPFLGVPFAIKESMQFKGFHNSTELSVEAQWCVRFSYLKGGCGCIVSAAGVPFAIGSDIGGSIRLPSFMNGIFGHKTTPDIVPNDCQYPPHKDFHQKYLLATGPMCRYASDLHPMLKALGQEHISQKLPNFNTPVDLSKLRYFYIDDIDAYFVNKISKEQKQAHRRVVDHFERKYNVHVTRLRLTRLRYAVSLWSSMMVDGQLQTRDFGLTLNNRQDYINGYHELLKKFLFRSTHTLPAIGLAILECIPNRYNQRFHIMAHKFYEEIQSMLQDNGVLFFPSFPHSAPEHCWPLLLNTFDYIYCGIINALGLPSTQCPLGLDSKQLPLGIQVVAGRYQDHLTIACAQEIENAIGGWIPPSPVAYI
ncbi:unnamed protein product, partial [Didymodactylos carnosus]